MMVELHIYRPEDKSELISNEALYSQILSAGGTVWSEEMMESLIIDYFEEGTRLLLFMNEGGRELIGFSLVSLTDHTCDDSSNMCAVCSSKSEKCLYVRLLGIHPNFRGQRKLEPFIDSIRAFAKTNGYTCIRLTSLNQKVGSIYEQHNFSYEVPNNTCLNMKAVLFGRRLCRKLV